MNKIILLVITFFTVSACTTGSLLEQLPDRRPDYRQSNTRRKIELPPDLSRLQTQNPDINPPTTYSAYEKTALERSQRDFIDVLPALKGVEVVEQKGELPYIRVDADATTAWRLVEKYWQNQGITLKVDEPTLGIMETDWLENLNDRPQNFINKLLGFVHDTDRRDHYRLHFSRQQNQTLIQIIYRASEQVADYDFPTHKTPSGFHWQLSDTENPALQLEMTRRIALFIAQHLAPNNAHISAAPANSFLQPLADGQPALWIQAPYAQAWQLLETALEKTGFAIVQENYQEGRFRVHYSPATAHPLFSRSKKSAAESYTLRLSDQGEKSLVIVQNRDGGALSAAKAQTVLTRLKTRL